MNNRVFLLPAVCGIVACVNAQDIDENTTYRSVEVADRVEYPELEVPNSRLAVLLSVADLLRRKGFELVIGPPLPIEYGEPGEEEPAWEVGFYDAETGKVRYVYVVEANTGFVHLVCDRTEDPDCG